MSARCFECGAPADHEHHVVPQSLGGTQTVPLCESHHGVVHERGGMVGHRALTKAGFARVRAAGKHTGGCVQFGYMLDADGETLVVNPDEQVVISRVYELRARGMSLRAIAATLAECGVRGRTGRPFAVTQVQRILKHKPRPARALLSC